MKICYSYNSRNKNINVNWWPYKTLQIRIYNWVFDSNPRDSRLINPTKYITKL